MSNIGLHEQGCGMRTVIHAMPKGFISKTIVLSLALFVMGSVPAHGQPGQRSLPPVLSTLSDEAGVLTVTQGRKLAETLSDIEEQTGVTVVMLILTTARPEGIEAYVLRLIDHWRRESKRLDHGRFVFVAVARDDRAVRIVPSEKLAWVLKAIGDSDVAVKVPALLKQDRYFEALSAIAKKLSQLIADQGGIVLPGTETRPRITNVAIKEPRYP